MLHYYYRIVPPPYGGIQLISTNGNTPKEDWVPITEECYKVSCEALDQGKELYVDVFGNLRIKDD